MRKTALPLSFRPYRAWPCVACVMLAVVAVTAVVPTDAQAQTEDPVQIEVDPADELLGDLAPTPDPAPDPAPPSPPQDEASPPPSPAPQPPPASPVSSPPPPAPEAAPATPAPLEARPEGDAARPQATLSAKREAARDAPAKLSTPRSSRLPGEAEALGPPTLPEEALPSIRSAAGAALAGSPATPPAPAAIAAPAPLDGASPGDGSDSVPTAVGALALIAVVVGLGGLLLGVLRFFRGSWDA